MIFIASYMPEEGRSDTIGASDNLGSLLRIVNKDINSFHSSMYDSEGVYFEMFGDSGLVIAKALIFPRVDDSIDPDEVCSQTVYHSITFEEVMMEFGKFNEGVK